LAQLLAQTEHWVEAKDVLRRYEKVSQVSPNSLLLASEIEYALGNTKLSEGYGEMLLRMYPSEPATAKYLQQRNITSPATPPVARKLNKTLMLAPSAVIEPSTKKALVLEATKSVPLNSPVVEDSDIVVESAVDDPDVEIPDVVPEYNATMPPPGETTEPSTANKVTTKKPVIEDEVTEVIADSEKEDVITPLAENNQEIEHAEIVVVEESEPATEQGPTFHIVQKEENLYRISLLYNIKMQRLIEWNNLPDAASIYIGKKLIIVAPETQE
jgi:type IV pilus assembly protein PilF